MKPSEVIYYGRAIIGFLTGLVCTFITAMEMIPLVPWLPALVLAIAIYILTYKTFIYLFPTGLKRHELALTGIEAYVFMWLFSWTFFYTILGYWAS